MCLICVEFQKQKMTTREARRALGELRVALDPTHVREVERMLADAGASPREPAQDEDE